MKALIAEPTKAYRQLLETVCHAVGFKPLFFTNTSEALQHLSLHPVDLVLTSLQLLDNDGINFCKKIRELKDTKHIPVVLLTAEKNKTIEEPATQAGITEIFHKSDIPRLQTYLSELISRASTYNNMDARVLYVEDSLSVAKLTIHILEAMGLDIDHFTHAEHAYEAFQTTDYDLVLTDIFLAGNMSGVGLVRAIRSTEGNKIHIPVLTMSAQDDSARKIELLNCGANDYVAKPILKEELMARVHNLITNKKLLDKLKAQQHLLQELAMTDQLTELYNRHFLMEIAPKHISEAFRHKQPLSLIVIDLDNFKTVNDTHGHSAGDIVLTQTARLLKTTCRNEDIAARFGGEEFVLILRHCDAESARKKAEVLRMKIADLNPEGIAVSASFGVAELPLDSVCKFDVLFSAADHAVYEAKARGRNCVVIGKVSAPEMGTQ
ncbi:MAG: diguanylate cyclase [Gammaproteobacteria bacterium]|nr:diguanylate cyclase [Gammaproteobacteria bacterium]